MMLLRICGTPVPMTPRSTSDGSSPNPMRHLIAGSFKSYFTMVVNGGFMRDPIVPYSLITKRSAWGHPSGYGGAGPRPRPPGGCGRIHTEPDPATRPRCAPDG